MLLVGRQARRRPLATSVVVAPVAAISTPYEISSTCAGKLGV